MFKKTTVSKLLLLSLAMSLAFAAHSTVYLDTGPCNTGDEVWYAYTWSDNVAATWTAHSSVSEGVYEFDLDGTTGSSIIFVRMNPNASSVPSWDAKWNQTDNLTLVNGGTFKLTGFNGDRMNGYWIEPVAPTTGKPVWQQTDASAANYIGHRKALTGRHCMVNKLINVVGVGSWVSDLNNLVDEDLNNYATFPKIVDATVGVSPITSIRDTKNHYAAGTTAGFTLVAGSGSSLLSLDIVNAFAITFYLEGELVQTVPVQTGQNAGGVGLSLITIPGSSDVCIDLSATAPAEFDEVSLFPSGGVDLSAITSTKIKYAFVGDYVMNTITDTSMQNYAAAHNRLPFSLDQGSQQRQGGNALMVQGTETGYWAGSDLINDDLTDGVAWGVLSIGTALDCRVGAAPNRADPDQSMPFKAGSTVGFMYGNGSILKLPVGKSVVIKLYKGEWVQKSSALWGTYYEYVQTEVQSETVDANVLSLNLISGGKQQATITAKEDFSHARITFPTGLTIDVGGTKAYYAFICDPATVDHHCDLKLTADAAICSSESQYQLTSGGVDAEGNPIDVTWTVASQPSGASAQVSADGLLTGMSVEGDYVVRATASDGCSDEVTITRGLFASSATCDSPMTNESEGTPYVLSDKVSGEGGALININSNLVDAENVLSPSLEDYATYANAINATVVENLPIVGVKNANGNISNGHARRIGFLVEIQSNGLGLDAIDLFNLRTYKNGVQTSSQVVSENNAVRLKLIGSSRIQKMRFAVTIPDDVEFDEFVLWKSGVLDASVDPRIVRMKVFYAFADNADDEGENECIDPLGCDATVLSSTSGATLNSNEIQFAGAINVANVMDNLSYLVDGDITTGVSITNTVSLGTGVVLAVDLGHVYDAGHQIGMVVDEKTYLARVRAGNWVTMKTYLDGVEQESQSDWSVLGVNAIGYGDKSYIFMTPTKAFDEVRITIAAIADALSFDQKYYDIFVRNDYDQDGIPDCHDDDSCLEEFTLDEEGTTLAKGRDYSNANLALHRSFNLGQWNCIVLPVDLTWLQLRNAFGNDVQLAEPADFYTFNDEVNVLTYNPYDSSTADDVTAIEAGKYYMILPSREADMPAVVDNVPQIYTTRENKQQVSLNGPVYFISDVSYNQQWDNASPDALELHHKSASSLQGPARRAESNETVVMRGSMVYLDGAVNSMVPASTSENEYYKYTDNNKLEMLQEDYNMLGFRFYLENRTSLPLSHGDDLITSISEVLKDPLGQKRGVYTIDGRRVNDNAPLKSLPAGVYIINGQKVIVGNR